MVALFEHYKDLAEKALAQVRDEDLHRILGEDGNSIAVIMRHMAGNMRSRFTDFLLPATAKNLGAIGRRNSPKE